MHLSAIPKTLDLTDQTQVYFTQKKLHRELTPQHLDYLVLSHKTSKSVFGVTDQEDQTLKNKVFCWMLLNPAKRQMSKPLTASGESLPRDITILRPPWWETKSNFCFFVFRKLWVWPVLIPVWCITRATWLRPSKMNNVFNAAYTHLKMYCYLEKLQNRVLYTDTKSLLYPVRDGEAPRDGCPYGWVESSVGRW